MNDTLSDLQTLTEKLAHKLNEPHDAGLDERIVALLQQAIRDVFDYEIRKISDVQLELAAAHAEIQSLKKEVAGLKK